MTSFSFQPIGIIRSCFPEKFGIPRQPGLAPDATAVLDIHRPFQKHEAFRHLELFSHIWVLFVFHRCLRSEWKSTVRPPRLGGNRRVGVFASRSGFRPNPIGQSAVELVSIEKSPGKISLHAQSGFAPVPPPKNMPVRFSDEAARFCRSLETQSYPRLQHLIVDLLAQDPRPGYAPGSKRRTYGIRLWNLNIRFEVHDDHIAVISIETANQNTHDGGRCPPNGVEPTIGITG
jgi:tRNA-Thr(GGU) m(6)t(6)A37 methyltransferase TsaA